MKKYECKACGSVLLVPVELMVGCDTCGTDISNWHEVKEEPTTPDQSKGKGYQVWHTPYGQIFMPAGWDGKPVEGEMLYLAGECPGCEEKDAEIRQLGLRDKSRLVDIAGLEADLGRAYDKADEIDRLNKVVELLNHDSFAKSKEIERLEKRVAQLVDTCNGWDARCKRLEKTRTNLVIGEAKLDVIISLLKSKDLDQ